MRTGRPQTPGDRSFERDPWEYRNENIRGIEWQGDAEARNMRAGRLRHDDRLKELKQWGGWKRRCQVRIRAAKELRVLRKEWQSSLMGP